MKEKKLTIEEFNKAVQRVIEKQGNDPKIKEAGMADLMLSLSGVVFAGELRRELFGEDEKE